MALFTHSQRFKRVMICIVSVLTFSSIFGFVFPHVFTPSEETSPEIAMETAIFNTHPLEGISDNQEFCNDSGDFLHEIYLCGANDERVLTTNIPNLTNISWAKLQEGSCPAASPGCGNFNPACTWDELSTDTQFTVTESGQYRIFVNYSDGTPPGRYFFNVTANGLNPQEVVTHITCAGAGSITINNMPNNYQYRIENGANWQTEKTFTVPAAGRYTVLIESLDGSGGCTFRLEDIEVRNDEINATAEEVAINCNASNGIQVEVIDGAATYDYNIYAGTTNTGALRATSGGPISANTYTSNSLDPGQYLVEVTLANGSCPWTQLVTVEQFDPSAPSATVTKNIDCNEGIVNIATSGFNAPYEYSIDGTTFLPFTNGNQTNVPISTAGNYTIIVRDNKDCEIPANEVTMAEEPELTVTPNVTNVSCNGTDNGNIIVEILDARGYSVTFSLDGAPFQTSSSFGNLAAGSYELRVRQEKSGNQCTSDPISVTVGSDPSFTITTEQTQQLDCDTGSATIRATLPDGSAPPASYTFSLDGNTFQNNPEFTGLGAGNYTLIADDGSCIAESNFTISAGSDPTDLTFAVPDSDCAAGTSNLQLTVVDGTGPYTYSITAGAGTGTTNADGFFPSLSAGAYTFQVVTADGCRIIRNYNLIDPSNITVATQVLNNASCATGSTNGSFSFSVTEFQTTYSYTVTNGGGSIIDSGTNTNTNTTTLSGLAPDDYEVTVTDDTSTCFKTTSLTIAVPSSAISVSHTLNPMNCGNAGSVAINASGGWGAFSYQLRRQSDGSFHPAAPQNSATITGLTDLGETYDILVTDANGCTDATDSFTLTDAGGPTVEVDAASPDTQYCYQNSQPGSLRINITAGSAPYYYTINDGSKVDLGAATTFVLNNLTPDDYEIKVGGANLCETLVADTNISGQLFALANVDKPLGCGGDAEISINAEEGYPPYTYEVKQEGAPDTAYASTVSPHYSSVDGEILVFRVTDDKGCQTVTQPITIKEAPPITFTTEITDTKCGIAGTGAVKIIPWGGTAPFQIDFERAAPSATFNGEGVSDNTLYNNLDARDYRFVITDALGCTTGIQTITIAADDPLDFAVDTQDTTCRSTGGMNWGFIRIRNPGAANDQPTNAVGPLTFSVYRIRSEADYLATGWSRRYRTRTVTVPANGIINSQERMYWRGHFLVRVEDARGCIYETFRFVDMPELPNNVVTRPAPSATTQTCVTGAQFDLNITNSAMIPGPYRYRVWPFDPDAPTAGSFIPFDPADTSTSFSSTTRIEGLLFGVNYGVVVIDANGCQRWKNMGTIPHPEGTTVTAVTESISCRSSSDGRVQLTVTDFGGGTDLEYRIYRGGSRGRPSDVPYEFGTPPTTLSFPVSAFTGPNTAVYELPHDLLPAWYVAEIYNPNNQCQSAVRFLIQRPRSSLKIEFLNKVDATCHRDGKIAVNATGGWDDQRFFERNNTLRGTWEEYQYAFVPVGNPVTDPDFGPASDVDRPAGSYDVYVKDAAGCIVQLDMDDSTAGFQPVVIELEPEPSNLAFTVPNRCASPSDEIYTVNATVDYTGTDDLQFIWNGEITDSATRNLGPGDHTLEVRNANGCFVSTPISIYPSMVIKQIPNIVQEVSCDPGNDGSIQVEVYGGSESYEFALLNPPAGYVAGEETNTTGLFANLDDGVAYEFTVEDLLSGCPIPPSVSFTLDTPADPEFEISTEQDVACGGLGSATGKVFVQQISGSSNTDVTYEYAIRPTSSTATLTYGASDIFEDLAADTYTVYVRSSKNCVQSFPAEIEEPALLQVSLAAPAPYNCNTGNEVTITAAPVDGTAPYLYSFNGNSFTADNTLTVTYKDVTQDITVIIKDDNGCEATSNTVTVEAIRPLQAVVDATNGGSGAQPMTCIDDAVFRIDISDGSGSYEVVNLTTGSVETAAAPYEITIPQGSPVADYFYEVHDLVTDCRATVTYKVNEYNYIEVAVTGKTDLVCKTLADGTTPASDGSFTFQAASFGGSGFRYEVFRADGSSQQATITSTDSGVLNVPGLPAGSYYVQVTDIDSGCVVPSENVTIQAPPRRLSFTYSFTQEPSCNPGNDSEITAIPEGGWGGYEFELVHPTDPSKTVAFGSNYTFSNLDSDTNYELFVRDSRGCANYSETISTPLIEPIREITSSKVVNDPSCPKGDDGFIEVVVDRGSGTYQYSLVNNTTGVTGVPQDSNRFENLREGDYEVIVTDGRNCDLTITNIVLTDPLEVTLDVFISLEPSCAAGSGRFDVTPDGGTAPLTIYYVYTDMDGNANPSAQWTSNNVPTPAGTYEFTAVDNSGCSAPLPITRVMPEVAPLDLVVDDTNARINCFGDMDGVLVATATGGKGNYQYTISPVPTGYPATNDTGIFENLGSGSYTIDVVSLGYETSCSRSEPGIVPDATPLRLPVDVIGSPVLCFGEETGTASVVPLEGAGPFQFFNLSSDTPEKAYDSGDFVNLPEGDHDILVQDVNGCQEQTVVRIGGPTAPLTFTTSVIDEVCSGDNGGQITLTIAGGTAPYNIRVVDQNDGTDTEYNAISGTTYDITGLSGGFYEVYVTDANNCEPDVPVVLDEVETGANIEGSITEFIECREGIPFYGAQVVLEDQDQDMLEIVYALDPIDPLNPQPSETQSSNLFEAIGPGDHTISIVHMGTGCVLPKTFSLDAQDELTLTTMPGNINEILVAADGGDGTYTYYFEGVPSASPSYYINRDGTYTVRVVDGKGCEAAVQITMEFIDIEIPNFFSPNNDGENDTWRIKNSNAFPDITVKIFDRFGRTLKQFVGEGEWNGTYNGEDLPTGDYWYVLKLNGERDDREFIGHFSIYR